MVQKLAQPGGVAELRSGSWWLWMGGVNVSRFGAGDGPHGISV